MRINSKKAYAILTGDVVGSTRLTPHLRRTLQRAIGRAGRAVRRAFPRECPLALDAFRGDGWQLLVVRPAVALRVALYFRAMLRIQMESSAVDSRVSLGIGKIHFIPGDKISEGDGPAYWLSGQGLDEMERHTRLQAHFETEPAVPLLNALLVLTDALASGWTVKQAQAIVGALAGWTQDTIAAKWKPSKVSQQAVAQHLERARWHAIERALDAFEHDLAEN